MTTTVLPEPRIDPFASAEALAETHAPSESVWARALRSGRVVVGGGILLVIVLFCVATLAMTLSHSSSWSYEHQDSARARIGPSLSSPVAWYGFDNLGRSILARCLLGGTISMGVGIAEERVLPA